MKTEKGDYLSSPKGFATKAIHHGQEPDQWDCLSVVPPLVLSSTFKLYSPENRNDYFYGRIGNPNRDLLEQTLAVLESGKHGFCFSSGIGAVSAVLAMLKTGSHIVCSDDIYGGTTVLFNEVGSSMGVSVTYVDITNVKNIENAIQSNTKLVWVESITNPLLQVVDVKAISEVTKKHNVLLGVDNTFLTPYYHRPLELGADLVVHSLTKYINGHSDVIMGAIVVNDDALSEELRFHQRIMGIIPSPFDCYQVSRSLKTLTCRMKQHSYNALRIAVFLEDHPNVLKVIHPGLKSHPQHELFKSQTSGHSGMLAFYIKGGLKQCKSFLNKLKIFTLAYSLGGFESLIEIPSIMTHAATPPERRKVLNITDNLLRLSAGLEDVEDLIEDLKQALDSI